MRLTFILCCMVVGLYAQTFVAEGTLPTVTRDGFYRIAIGPSATAFLTPSFENLRIVDETGKETPYIIKEEVPIFSTPQFKEYKILEKKYEKGCCTKLILSNPEKKPINNISLQIKNAETSKEATLLGSDDRVTWYALKEHFYLNAIDGGHQTFEMRILDFPLSNYPFLSFTINDSTTAPLNIVRAGYYDVNSVSGIYSNVPSLKFSVRENRKEKQTILTIEMDTARLIDKLQFFISGQPFYHRTAILYETSKRINKKKQVDTIENYIQSFALISTHAASIGLGGRHSNPSGMKLQNLKLVIENNDNPPLQIDFVKAFQLNRYATAYLKKGTTYQIKMGDSKISAPVYDLNFFRDSIPEKPTLLIPTGIEAISMPSQTQPSTLFNTTLLIWVAIVVVAIVLGYMSVKMVREKGGV
jgi:hypothetical protein